MIIKEGLPNVFDLYFKNKPNDIYWMERRFCYFCGQVAFSISMARTAFSPSSSTSLESLVTLATLHWVLMMTFFYVPRLFARCRWLIVPNKLDDHLRKKSVPSWPGKEKEKEEGGVDLVSPAQPAYNNYQLKHRQTKQTFTIEEEPTFRLKIEEDLPPYHPSYL